MTTQKKTAATARKKRTPKKVIEHDPLSMSEEPQEDEPVTSEPNISSASQGNSTPVDLGGSLVISEVDASRGLLLDALQAGRDLVIDGAEIQQIDGAGLQLLAAFALEAERMHIAFTWSGASAVLCNASDQLGLTKALQLDKAA